MGGTVLVEPRADAPGGWHRSVDRVRSTGFAAVATGFVALAICLIHLSEASMWEDELATVSAATRPLGALVDLSRHVDASLFPYYALMHVWALPSQEDWWLRLPSALAMGGAAAGVCVLGARLIDVRAGVLGALAFSALPMVSRYGQEARVYALATCAAVWATVLLVGFIRRGNVRGYGVAVLVAGLLQPFTLLMLLPHAVAVASRRRPEFMRWLAWSSTAALPAVVLAVAAAAQHSAALQYASLDWTSLRGLPDSLLGSRAVLYVVLTVLVVAWPRSRRSWLLVTGVLLPPVALIAASAITPLLVPRYVLFVVAPLALLVGAALARLPVASALLVLAVLGMVGLPVQQALRATHGEDWRGAAQVIASHEMRGDRMVYAPGVWMQPMEHYLRGDMPTRAFATAAPRDGYASDQDIDDRRLFGVGRVWLVVRDTDFGPSLLGRQPVDYLAPAQRAALVAFRGEHVWRRRHIEVWLMVKG